MVPLWARAILVPCSASLRSALSRTYAKELKYRDRRWCSMMYQWVSTTAISKHLCQINGEGSTIHGVGSSCARSLFRWHYHA